MVKNESGPPIGIGINKQENSVPNELFEEGRLIAQFVIEGIPRRSPLYENVVSQGKIHPVEKPYVSRIVVARWEPTNDIVLIRAAKFRELFGNQGVHLEDLPHLKPKELRDIADREGVRVLAEIIDKERLKGPFQERRETDWSTRRRKKGQRYQSWEKYLGEQKLIMNNGQMKVLTQVVYVGEGERAVKPPQRRFKKQYDPQTHQVIYLGVKEKRETTIYPPQKKSRKLESKPTWDSLLEKIARGEEITPDDLPF